MTFGAPGALWWLLLVPLVVLLYMLRARRQPFVVPSTLLWVRATRDLLARMPVRRLERSLLLLLQVLAIAALALALARPSIALPGIVGDAVVLVVQATASMQATDRAPTRLAAAVGDARALLARLGPRQPAAVIVAGRRPLLLVDFTTDRAALAARLASLRASDAGGSVDEAVALAASLRTDGRPARVHVFGDRPPGDARVTWHPVGGPAPNAGIAVAAAREEPTGSRLLVRVQAFGATAQRTLVVQAPGRPPIRRDVRVRPGTATAEAFDLGRAAGVVTVTLEGRDALPADDRAVVLVGPEALPRVLVAGPPNPVLDAVLAAVPTGGVRRAQELTDAALSEADLIVLDGLPPVTLPPGAYLLLGTLAENLPLSVEGTARDQVVRQVTATHPVARLADLRGVRIARSLALRPLAGTVLADGTVPLLWAYEGRGVRVVLLPFLLQQSDLPLHPAFPVLVANVVEWLAGARQAAPGETPVVPAGVRRTAILTAPDGTTGRVEARDGLFVLPPLDRVGIWRLAAGRWQRRFVVSTVDPVEADLTRVQVAAGPASPPAPRSATLPLAPWLLTVAAGLVIAEWLLWARTLPPERRPARPRRPL